MPWFHATFFKILKNQKAFHLRRQKLNEFYLGDDRHSFLLCLRLSHLACLMMSILWCHKHPRGQTTWPTTIWQKAVPLTYHRRTQYQLTSLLLHSIMIFQLWHIISNICSLFSNICYWWEVICLCILWGLKCQDRGQRQDIHITLWYITPVQQIILKLYKNQLQQSLPTTQQE